MEQKTRLIIVVLAAVAILSLIAAFGLNNTKQVLSRDLEKTKQDLNSVSQERDSLIGQINSTKEDRRRLQEKLDSITRNLDQLSRERDDYKQRFETISREKDELLGKIQSMSRETTQVSQQLQIPQGTEDVYWANILKQKADLELQVTNLRDELKKMQIKVEETTREKANADLQLSSVNQEKEDLDRKLKYNERLVELLSSDLVKETKDRRAMEEQMDTLKAENRGLKSQFKELGRTKINLEKKVQTLEDQNSTLERRMDETNTILEQKVGEMIQVKEEVSKAQSETSTDASSAKPESKSVELPPIVVKPQQGQVVAGSSFNTMQEGRVIAINKDNNFVVIDLGEEKGVRQCQPFKVYRDNQAIADVEVIQVRRAIAACDIVKAAKEIRVGDTVKAN